MKGLKSKLMAATAMLTVSAVMLVSTSFAWYTLSTNPEVKNIKATAVANQNLEIALVKTEGQTSDNVDTLSNQNRGTQGSKTSDYFTWGNSVQYDVTDNVPELRPATYIAKNDSVTFAGKTESVDNAGLYIPTYGTDGRVSGLNETALVSKALEENKSYTTVGVENGTQYAARYDIWMRTNKAGVITLAEAGTTLADGSGDNTTGAGSYISTTKYKNTNTGSPYPAEAIKVVFHITGGDVDSWVEATNATTASTDNKVAISVDAKTGLFTATANTVYKVQMYVYLNGQVVTNAMAGSAVDDLAVNVQFDNSGIDAGGAMTK